MGRRIKPLPGQESMLSQTQYGDEQSLMPDGPTRARNTDPETSHRAAKSITNLTKKQLAVHALLRVEGPMTDDALVRFYMRCVKERVQVSGVVPPEQSPSGIRTRRNELATAEPPLVRVKDSVILDSGNKARRWEAIPLGRVMEGER